VAGRRAVKDQQLRSGRAGARGPRHREGAAGARRRQQCRPAMGRSGEFLAFLIARSCVVFSRLLGHRHARQGFCRRSPKTRRILTNSRLRCIFSRTRALLATGALTTVISRTASSIPSGKVGVHHAEAPLRSSWARLLAAGGGVSPRLNNGANRMRPAGVRGAEGCAPLRLKRGRAHPDGANGPTRSPSI